MPQEQKRATRVQCVDALRGFVMIIMALDHVRDFFHADAMLFQPEDLTRTTPILFFTRWITHICAPTFMFTAGIGAYLWFSRGRTKAELSRFLVTRGLWLVFLDLTVERFALNFRFIGDPVLFIVLWALGWSMVILAALVHLPQRVLTVLSVATILLHNLTDGIEPAKFGHFAWLWNILHVNGAIRLTPPVLVVAYPLVPWFAVMALGFCFGPVINMEPAARRKIMIRLGAAMTVAFIILRSINLYGDPLPWKNFTVLAFLRCLKYPPSLDFLLMTLGPALLIMAWFDKMSESKPFSDKNPLIVFGRVPLFYFLVHFSLAHLMAFPLAFVRYGRVDFLFAPARSMGGTMGPGGYPDGYGYSLGVVYLLWATVVIVVYPMCLWYSRLKARRRDWWLSYL